MNRWNMAGWAVPAGLLALGSLPILTGALALAGIAKGLSGGEPGADPGFYLAHPLPIVTHIVAGVAATVLGALQFAPGLGVPRRGWHRWAGRAFVAAGLASAATAIHMTAAFPVVGGWSKESASLVFGLAQAGFLIAGLAAILRRDVAAHRAWLLRAYALVLGAGTQSLLILPVFLVAGLPGDPWLGLMVWGCWLVNLGVAEIAVRRGGPASRLVPT